MKVLYKLYPGCFITRGHNRSVLVDSQRDTYYYIPNSMTDLFLNDSLEIEDHELKSNLILKEYLDFVINNEVCYKLDSYIGSTFTRLMNDYQTNAIITNAVIEIDNLNQTNETLYSTIETLTRKCNMRYADFILYNIISIEILSQLLSELDKFDLHSYNIAFDLPTLSNNNITKYVNELKSHHKIFRSELFNSPNNEIIQSDLLGWGNIFTLKEKYTPKCCGQIHTSYFNTNIKHYQESLKYNTCLNQKLSIDLLGNIKNCPSMEQIFGNIFNENIVTIINNSSLKQIWTITKDQIDTCSICEHRNICSDCRAYIEQPENLFSKPLKCGYDPQTNTWQDWKSIPSKFNAIKEYSFI